VKQPTRPDACVGDSLRTSSVLLVQGVGYDTSRQCPCQAGMRKHQILESRDFARFHSAAARGSLPPFLVVPRIALGKVMILAVNTLVWKHRRHSACTDDRTGGRADDTDEKKGELIAG